MLKAEGLGDIERTTDNGDVYLKHYASNVFRDAPSAVEREARLAHFLECSRLCQTAKFKNRLEKKIMASYCEGEQVVEISKDLQKRGIKLHRTTISNVIRKWLILFGLYNHGK